MTEVNLELRVQCPLSRPGGGSLDLDVGGMRVFCREAVCDSEVHHRAKGRVQKK